MGFQPKVSVSNLPVIPSIPVQTIMLEQRTVRGIQLAFEWIDGGSITHETRESELIVFLHGVGADRCAWVPQVQFFSQLGYTVAAVDMRGSGESQTRDERGLAIPITMEDFAADVHALIGDLGFERAHWVGNSMGGVVIMEAFRKGYSTIAKAVFCNTFAKHPEAAAILPRPGIALKTRSLAEFAAERIPFAHASDIAPDVLRESIQSMATKDVETYLLSWRETWSHDYRSVLPMVTVPSLVITGTLDKITPPALGEEIARLIPDAQYKLIEGASHLSNLDRPLEFNEAVYRFLKA
jgi:3-oxoadipate enol-lactonase